jgi:Ca2+-dependent lipid-binding protein
MYGLNLLIWREKRINYAFIFEFSINTELKHREVLLVASGLTTLIVGGLLGHFMAYTHFSSANNALIPLAIILVYLSLSCTFICISLV